MSSQLTPAVLVTGPRQSGKTTLVRAFAGTDRAYISLDDDTVLAGVRMLLKQGITVEPEHIEKGKDLALKTLEQVDGLRAKLQGRLEEELAKAEIRWGSTEQPSDQFLQLRQAAQKIADQLSQVEEMEEKLERLLEGKEKHQANPYTE